MRSIIEVGGLRVGFERVGSGPAVVLLHGFVGDGRSTWGPQIDRLCDAFTVVAWDAPGTGRSSDPPEEFGMAGYADCLAGFIAAAGLARPHLVGLSFGGALAIATVARHPGIARSLVVVSGYAGWRGSLPVDVAEDRLAQALALSGRSPAEFVDTLLPTMFASAPAAEHLELFEACLRSRRPMGFRAMARASVEDLRPLLTDVDVPTLVIHGDRDERSPRPVAQQLQASITGSTLTVLDGLGHVCNLEDPARFNRHLRGWLSGQT